MVVGRLVKVVLCIEFIGGRSYLVIDFNGWILRVRWWFLCVYFCYEKYNKNCRSDIL